MHKHKSQKASTQMAFMAALESDLRALSAEARRRYPAVKDGAEHAILKVSVRIAMQTYIYTATCMYVSASMYTYLGE